jgi:aminoglycoside phosphotransferase (APT) family kinase protein
MTDAGAVSGWQGLTAEWLTRALAPMLDGAEVTDVQAAPVGTGQVSDTVRLTLAYSRPAGLPATMVAKVPSADPASRHASRATRTYEIEARFYAEIAPGLDASIPRCLFVAYDAGADDYVVLLEDLAPAVPGDQLRGIQPADARAAVEEMAALHAACWDSPALAAMDWLNRGSAAATESTAAMIGGLFDGFRDRYATRLAPETITVMEKFVPRLGAYLTSRGSAGTLAHCDFRADNLMFGTGRPTIVDWQSCRLGPGTGDLSYFLGSSLPVQHRREHEHALVRHYHGVITARGVHLDWARCWEEYRAFAFQGILTAIGAAMLVKRTERGDMMFCAMADRHARHALDLDSLSLLP